MSLSTPASLLPTVPKHSSNRKASDKLPITLDATKLRIAPSAASYGCRTKPAAILVLFATCLPGEALGETVTGVASVIDGDTIEIRGTRISLSAIDAPEIAQRCTDHGKLHPSGLDSPHALAKQIGHKPVSCVPRDTDRYGRMVAVCTMGNTEINRWMITQGQAIAYRKYSRDLGPS